MIEPEKCKILMLGQSAVGKSSLFRTLTGNPNSNVTPTIGAECKQKLMTVNGKQIKIQLWDTAGTERYRTISSIYYRNLDGVILVFDITDASSFTGLNYWLDQLEEKGEGAQVVLIGNKNDEAERREVARQDGQKKGNQLKIDYFQTNSRSQQQVMQIFTHLVQMIMEKREKNPTQINETHRDRSQFQELRATDLTRKRIQGEGDCC